MSQNGYHGHSQLNHGGTEASDRSAQQHGLPAPSSQTQPPPQNGQPVQGGMYDDPRNLLAVYPFATYQPVARAAMHLSPHTTTYAPPSSSSSLYPQYADTFARMDQPGTQADVQARAAAVERMRHAMQQAGPSYYPSHNTQATSSSSRYESAATLSYPSHIVPMAYDLLPSYVPSPASSTTSTFRLTEPASTVSRKPAEYFDNFVTNTLNRTQQSHLPTPDPSTPTSEAEAPPSSIRRPSSAASNTTPSLARAMSRADISAYDSPDPLERIGPSPSKKQKLIRQGSPTLLLASSARKTLHSGEILGGSGPSSSGSSLTPLSSQVNPSLRPTQRMVEVEIPVRRPSQSPQKTVVYGLDDESEEDDLGWDDTVDNDGDWQMDTRVPKSPGLNAYGRPIPPGSGRTGERDMRTQFQKLQSLFEDIFEESDSLPAEPSEGDLEHARFFSATDRGDKLPLLSDQTLEKISRYVTRIQKGKRRQSAINDAYEWDTETISRVLRLLERGMRDTDSISPFPSDKKSVATKKKGKGAKSKKDGSKSPSLDIEVNIEEVKPVDIEEGEKQLALLRSAGLAAGCCLTILDTDRLSKQLLSEDMLSSSISLVRDQITKVVIPVVEGLSEQKTSSLFLEHILAAESNRAKTKKLGPLFHHPILTSIVQSCTAALSLLTSLVSRTEVALSDQLVIQTVYLAITPLFVHETSAKKSKGKETGGSGIMKGLRVEALGCLRSMFAKYENQRQWITEEILGTMGKAADTSSNLARFPLANGSSIHTISALLLQLIQASASGIVTRVRKLRSSVGDIDSQVEEDQRKLDSLEEEIRTCSEVVDGAMRSARTVAAYLIQRSGAAKTTKASHDTDYKAILDMFIADLLAVLYRPEWPAAPLYLSVISRILISALEDRQSTSDTASKSIALDYLGDIAAKLRGFHVETDLSPVPSLDEIISGAELQACASLAERHRSVRSFLEHARGEDGMFSGALEMYTLVYAQELQSAVKRTTSIVDKMAAEKDEDAQETREKLVTIAQELTSMLQKTWARDDNVFGVAEPHEAAAAQSASIAISRGRSLQGAFNPILAALVSSMSSTIIAIRSKALRALGNIVTIDPEVLGNVAVRTAIEDRLSDSSPSVRDAAVELVGKYVVQKPNLAADYYPHLALRVTDTGLAVRKRVIKLLRGIFSTTSVRDIKVDICCKMITLTGDTDDNIKDLATKTLAEMLYSADHRENTADLLVDVIAEYQGGNVVLEGAIKEVSSECAKSALQARLDETVKTLFQRLSDATEKSDLDPLGHIRAINLLTTARPEVVDVPKAEILLSYLRRKPQNNDEQATNDILLKIFRSAIPSMPRVASSFAARLSDELLPMISVPNGNFGTLKETVACFCTIANHLTRDYSSILRILTSCEAKIRSMRNEWTGTHSATKASNPAAPILLFLCACVAEYCNLDKLSETNAAIDMGLRKISEQPLHEHLFDCFLDFTAMPIPQVAPSMCLGSLFRAYPILILRDQALVWMDGVFASNDTTTQARLLTVIYDFLVSESEKKQAQAPANKSGKAKVKKEKDLDALIGNAPDLSESGLSTAVVQRNIQHILDGARSTHAPTQNAALDILSFTVMQGLYHPLQCLPILISLETCDNQQIADRALELHHVLHSKHSTLVNVRYEEFARASYEYQRTLTAEVSGHRHGIALLSGWYGLISEKRAWKHDFLKQLARAFECDISGKIVPNVGFVLYLCDNLSTFEYKLQEEIMTVVHLLSTSISEATGLIMVLEKADFEGIAGDLQVAGMAIPTGQEDETLRADVVIHASIVIALALLTKNYLLDLYSIPEDKCIKHVLGKKSTVGDRSAQRKREDVLDTSRIAFVRGVTTVDDYRSQRATFLELIHEDGTVETE